MVNWVYPYCDKIIPSEIFILARMLIGQIFTTIAMIVAALVENMRLHSIWGDCVGNPDPGKPCNETIILQTFGGLTHQAADMSVFWLIPQYALIGFGEVFTVIAGYEYALRIAPQKMRGIIVGLFYALEGVGFLSAGGMFQLAQDKLLFSNDTTAEDLINFRGIWEVDKNFHESRLDIYYWILAIIQFCGLITFCFLLCYLEKLRIRTQQNRNHNLQGRLD